jgi:hypothetical protein
MMASGGASGPGCLLASTAIWEAARSGPPSRRRDAFPDCAADWRPRRCSQSAMGGGAEETSDAGLGEHTPARANPLAAPFIGAALLFIGGMPTSGNMPDEPRRFPPPWSVGKTAAYMRASRKPLRLAFVRLCLNASFAKDIAGKGGESAGTIVWSCHSGDERRRLNCNRRGRGSASVEKACGGNPCISRRRRWRRGHGDCVRYSRPLPRLASP